MLNLILNDRHVDIFAALFLLSSVLAVWTANKPMGRRTYLWRCVAVMGLYTLAMFGSLLALQSTIFAVLALGIILLANALQFRWNAMRFVDLGWSKYWFLTCPTVIAWAVIGLLPCFYKTRLAAKENQ